MDGTSDGVVLGENDDIEGSILGGSIHHKSLESSNTWEKIKTDTAYVFGVVQKYGIKKEDFFKHEYESVPKGEKESMEMAIGRIDKAISENSEMGLLGNYDISRRFEELCWGKK